MDEHPYKSQGALGEYATALTCRVDEDDLVVRGRSRKSGQRFHARGTNCSLGREHVVEDCAIALLKSELGTHPYPLKTVVFELEGSPIHYGKELGWVDNVDADWGDYGETVSCQN